jgi:hypothetical protein
MSPVEQAAAIYEREPCAGTFTDDLEAYLLHGLVHSSPTCFVMARYVCREWGYEAITDPWFSDSTCAPDCVHIHLAAGDIREMWSFPHCPMRWVSFERGNKLRFHDYHHILKRCAIDTR